MEKDRDDFDALVARINAHANVNWSEGRGGNDVGESVARTMGPVWLEVG